MPERGAPKFPKVAAISVRQEFLHKTLTTAPSYTAVRYSVLQSPCGKVG